jgi:hypothetical protein
MRLAQAVRVGAWLLVGLNLLMAFGTLGIFTRMSPAIAVILERNGFSLQAGDDMLILLAHTGTVAFTARQQEQFRAALDRAKANITETEEPVVLNRIEQRTAAIFRGDADARYETIDNIGQLGTINRDAMVKADHKAQQLGKAGAWGVVFMAVSAFLAGIIFIRNLTRRVVVPLEEIHTVMIAHRNGETMRRCTGVNLSQDIRAVFTGINEVLDQCQAQAAARHELASGLFVENSGRGKETTVS